MNATALHRSRFGKAPDLVVRSPGRINLIGDHTDYCGLPVLPMAIHQAIQIAISVRPEHGLAAVSSLDGAAFDTASLGPRPTWAGYIAAVLESLGVQGAERGARLAITSDLPATGGLSSSSALTVGCLVALNEIWGLGLDPSDLVAGAVTAERLAAIAGGAMDQTVIAYATPGNALRIDFEPAQLTHVPIPRNFVWVAGYSGTPAPKGTSAGAAYNSFVLASRAAARLLGDDSPDPRLWRVRPSTAKAVAALPRISVAQAATLLDEDDLGLGPDRIVDLRTSAEHVLSEADRVDRAEGTLNDGDLTGFGRLMDESHASLRRYGSSTSSLDDLVAAARDAGAAGARVTGAGFGGWAIALTSPLYAEPVAAAMKAVGGGPTLRATAEGGALWSLRVR